MRKVSIDMLTPDMTLGRSVILGDFILIRSGVSNLEIYKERLRQLGICNLYIEDSASEGISIDEAVSHNMRHRCKGVLSTTITKLRSNVLIDNGLIKDLIENLLEEILCKPHMLVSMSDIGRTGDNTLEHSINTTIYAAYLGMQLDYPKNKLAELAEGTLLHDIGKTLLNRNILFKPGRLTAEEFIYVKTHTTLGYDILEKDYGLSEYSRQIALCHHERLDGSGYPNGLSGKDISEAVKIAAIVDVYEALTADRCYRPSISPVQAIDILYEEAATKLDLGLVTSFVKNLAAYPNGTMVKLSDGNHAVVKMQNPSMPLRPVVRVIKKEGNMHIPMFEVDLMKTLNLTILDD